MTKIISNAIPMPALKGWFMIKTVRTGGRTRGKVDTSYFSPALKVFRSRVGVTRYITAQNNLPPLPAEVVAAPVLPAVPAAVAVAPVVAPVAAPVAAPVMLFGSFAHIENNQYAPPAVPVPKTVALSPVIESDYHDEDEDAEDVVIVIDSSSDDSEDDFDTSFGEIIVIESSSDEEIEL